MFIIMVPVLMAPAIFILYWGSRRAKRLGALLVADQGYAQRVVVEQSRREKFTSFRRTLIELFWQVDVPGLILLGFALGLFLVPFSLAAGAEGGFANRTPYFTTWSCFTEMFADMLSLDDCHARGGLCPLLCLWHLLPQICPLPSYAPSRLEQEPDRGLRHQLL